MMLIRTRTFVLWLVIFTIFVVLFFPRTISELAVSYQRNNDLQQSQHVTVAVEVPTEILFTGDIMLGRDVERRNLASNLVNALAIFDNFSEYDAVVINLEGSVPDRHIPTPDFGFQFSIRNEFVPLLQSAGITHVGLANNHSYDHGRSGYLQTRANIFAAGLVPFGHPATLHGESVAYVDSPHGRVAVVGIHTLFSLPEQSVIERELARAAETADFVVVYIHWGEEYELNQSRHQRRFAEVLVAAGADMIIGHHPHVVQGIEMVSGVPVVYSLGNTIFDQYFTQDVQEGLLVTLRFTEEERALVLHPITSVGTPTHPRIMEGGQMSDFLRSLAARSDVVLVDQIKDGVIIW